MAKGTDMKTMVLILISLCAGILHSGTAQDKEKKKQDQGDSLISGEYREKVFKGFFYFNLSGCMRGDQGIISDAIYLLEDSSISVVYWNKIKDAKIERGSPRNSIHLMRSTVNIIPEMRTAADSVINQKFDAGEFYDSLTDDLHDHLNLPFKKKQTDSRCAYIRQLYYGKLKVAYIADSKTNKALSKYIYKRHPNNRLELISSYFMDKEKYKKFRDSLKH